MLEEAATSNNSINQSMAAKIRTRPITPNSSVSTTNSAVRRRTRSASPAAMIGAGPSTSSVGTAATVVAAVQSALNRRQVEVHELQARLNTLNDKWQQVSRSETRWQQRTHQLEEELLSTKRELDTIRNELVEKNDTADN